MENPRAGKNIIYESSSLRVLKQRSRHKSPHIFAFLFHKEQLSQSEEMREREKEWIGHRKHIKYASVLLCINLVIRKTCEHKFCCFYIFSYFPSFFYRFTFLKNIAIVKRVSFSLYF
jgi:hypothetical protein